MTVVELFTVDSLHEASGASKEWLYDQLRSGALRGFKLAGSWRIHPDDWAAFVEGLRQGNA